MNYPDILFICSFNTMLLLIFLSVIASSSSTEDPLAGHRCTFVDEDGFHCLDGGGCIPMRWVCDKEEQVRAGQNIALVFVSKHMED